MTTIQIIIDVELAPGADIIGIKEDLANYCERFPDIKKFTVFEIKLEQMKMKM